MTTLSPNVFQPATRPVPVFVPATPARPRRQHRDRDFGVGYGNSSGYASGRRYADNWGNARFHCG